MKERLVTAGVHPAANGAPPGSTEIIGGKR